MVSCCCVATSRKACLDDAFFNTKDALPSELNASDRDVDDDGFAWIRPDEVQQIAQIRLTLTMPEREQLAVEPEDIRHDLMLCRFLRGHVERCIEPFRAFENISSSGKNGALLMKRLAQASKPQLKITPRGEDFVCGGAECQVRPASVAPVDRVK